MTGCQSVTQTDDQNFDQRIDELTEISLDKRGEPSAMAIPEPALTQSAGYSLSDEGAFELAGDLFDELESDSSHKLSTQDSATIKKTSYSEDGIKVHQLSLANALTMAIENSDFITDIGSFLSSNSRLLNDPQFLQSRFDLELQQTSQQGVEAALAEFDLQIATGFQWGQNSILQARNDILSSDILVNDNGTFYGRLDKPVMSGGAFSVIHNLNYAGSSQSFTLDPRYTGYLRGEFRQPLLAGRGRALTEIAGPNRYRTRRQSDGIALAEIAERTAELEYQLDVERLLKQTEELYWDYWLAVQIYEMQQIASDNAAEIWSRIRNLAATGLAGGGAADEAQAEENYYRRKSLAEVASTDLQQSAERLQHVTGLHCETGIIIEATTSPLDAPTVFDIESSRLNGLSNRKELIKQDLQINAIESQLFVAKQFNRPQLDLVSGVQFNGLGDQLFGSENGVLPDFVDTDDFGWNVGFEFSMPVGFNQERLNIRYLNLLLVKARSARQAQEKEILHEISFSAKSVDKWNRALALAKQRLTASEKRLAAVTADFKFGRASLDLFIRSQDSVAEAQLEVYRSVAALTKAQTEFLFLQGQN